MTDEHMPDDIGEATGEIEVVAASESLSATNPSEVTSETDGVAPPLEAPDRSLDGPLDISAPVISPRRGGLTTVLIEGVFGFLILVLLAANPFSFTVIEGMLGLALIAFGLFEGATTFRKRQGGMEYVQPVITVVVGSVLIVWPGETLVAAGYVLAGLVVVRGVLDIWAGIRRWHEHGANAWVFVRGVVLTTIGGAIALFPAPSVAIVVIAGSALAIARAVLTSWFAATNRDAVDALDPSDTFGVLTYWLSRREMDAAAADAVEDRVYLHRGNAHERLWRFGTLMFLATTIATFGIATDSTAVVIGAMLVAPLMTPILGTAAGLINGSTRAAAKSATVVFVGATGSIAVAWGFASLIPNLHAVVENSQITSRTAPTLLDLAIALAAGAAGAYGVSRAESTDALPGVAVAIALVPPLAVTGITLHAGDFDQVVGSVLLFLTNLFSILLMAGAVFIIVGYGSWGQLYHRRNRIRVSFAAVVVAMVLISIPLALTAQRIIRASNDLRDASGAVETWLGDGTTLRIGLVDVEGDVVTIQLVGPVEPPSADRLSRDISDRIGRDMTAIVRWVAETEIVSRTAVNDANSS